jgi:hypothetical protein
MSSTKDAKSRISNEGLTPSQPVFRLYFEFLRMSPSYELARLATNGELSDRAKKSLPSDFDVVLKTFEQIGDLRETSFKTWWRSRGSDLFGGAPTSSVQLLSDGSSSKNKTKSAHNTIEVQPTDIILRIPTSLSSAEAMRQITDLFAANRSLFNQTKSSKTASSGIQILSDRIHEEKLMKGLYLVQLKAEHPDIEIWQLGTQARLSEDYANELRPVKNLKRSMTGLEYDKAIMTKLTSRALKNYEAIIENSARGFFPSTEKLSHKFNYDVLKDLLIYYEG